MLLYTQFFCLIFAGLLVNVENKKYDVEAEAQKTYGQNLALVLASFRKTADYLKILTEKAKVLQTELAEVFAQIWGYYQDKMSEEISEMIGLNTVTASEAPTSPGRNMLRQRTAARRHDITEMDSEKQKKVNRIDNYDRLNSTLTVKERNEYKDLGFKYIGDAIHLAIEKMGVEGDGGEAKSTLMPSGNALRMRTTTEHARDHRVTKEPRTEAPGMDSD